MIVSILILLPIPQLKKIPKELLRKGQIDHAFEVYESSINAIMY
jgi:competence protein ComGC